MRKVSLAWIVMFLVVWIPTFAAHAVFASDEMVTVHFQDSGAVLKNPDMGVTSFNRIEGSNESSIAYYRWYWRDLELEEGQPNFVLIDSVLVRDEFLFAAIDRLRGAIPVIRVHTRAPITRPDRVTAELVAGLRELSPLPTVFFGFPPSQPSMFSRLVSTILPSASMLLNALCGVIMTLCLSRSM